MAFTLSPSVTVTEQDFSGIVSLVATTPAAFVGRFDKGPVNERILISSVKELQETFGTRGVKKVVVTCPHCFTTIGRDYKQQGFELQMVHHTQLLNQLVKEGKLKPIAPEKAPMLQFQLDLKGIACSKGSACQSGSSEGSHVLNSILSDEDLMKPSVRFSFCVFNTKEEVDYVVKVLKEFVEN